MSAAHTLTAELQDWIVQHAQAGASAPTITGYLRHAGWPQARAAAVVAQVLASQPKGSLPPPVVLPEPDIADSPTRLDLGDRQVQLLLQMQQPRVAVLGGFLTPEECTQLIAAARPRMARSLTVANDTGADELNQDRTSDGMFFQRGENALVQRIEERIARLLRWPLENGEGLQVLHYRPGAEYKPHYDYFDPAQRGTSTLLRRGGQRVATLVMYLNTPEQGGGTRFPEAQLEVAPQQGNAVFFSYARPDPSTRSLHAGAPVLAGEKWIATKWLREREFH